MLLSELGSGLELVLVPGSALDCAVEPASPVGLFGESSFVNSMEGSWGRSSEDSSADSGEGSSETIWADGRAYLH